jgi:ribosome-binding factor A
MSARLHRVEGLLRRAIAEILVRGDLRDPRLADPTVVSITAVRVAPDLGSARIFVDLMTDERGRDRLLRALNSAATSIRGQLGKHVRLKRTPRLRFEYDESLARAQAIETALAELGQPVAPVDDSE